jgi:hypothetical protein
MKGVRRIMKRIIFFMLAVFVLTGCSSNVPPPQNPAQNSEASPASKPEAPSSPVSGGQVDGNRQETSYVMVSQKYGFSLDAPASWKGRVKISEDNDGFIVRHLTASQQASAQNPILINIIEYGSEAYWDQESKKEDQPFPYEKVGVINGKVFASIAVLDFPYDEKSPKDMKEYTEMMDSVEKVLKSFKAHP